MNKLLTVVTKFARVLAASLIVVTVGLPVAANADGGRDCVANSIMWCGALTKTEWVNKVHAGDGHNSAANIQQIYFKEGRGITEADFKSSCTVDGVAYKDGRVVVGGKTVATGAKSIGRAQQPGAVRSGSVWMTPNQNAFLSGSISAWVDMCGGQFHWFILKSCGNAGVGMAVAKPTPAPTPKPAPKISPTPKPTPAPVLSFKCLSLREFKPADQPDVFRFTVDSNVDGVTLTGFRFTAQQEGSDNAADVSDTDAGTNFKDYSFASGTWVVQAQVKTSAGITAINDDCTAMVTVPVAPSTSPSPAPKPTGEVLGAATLPATGPEVLLGGAAGLTAIGYAGRAYLRSRKSLLAAMRTDRTNKS